MDDFDFEPDYCMDLDDDAGDMGRDPTEDMEQPETDGEMMAERGMFLTDSYGNVIDPFEEF